MPQSQDKAVALRQLKLIRDLSPTDPEPFLGPEIPPEAALRELPVRELELTEMSLLENWLGLLNRSRRPDPSIQVELRLSDGRVSTARDEALVDLLVLWTAGWESAVRDALETKPG